MQWVYRLQQRLAITRGECTVILVLAFLLGLGLAARYIQGEARPLPPEAYAEADRLFQQASEAPLAEATAMPAPAADTTGEAAPRPRVYTPKAAPPAASINLNTATASALQRLPRIGPKMAARIIAYRETHGAFRQVQDLVQVRGIGKKTLAQLTPYLTIDGEQAF